MIRILIVDDHAVVRQGVKQIVGQEADMTVVGEARSAEEMLGFIRGQECDVVVEDISMPGRSGLDALKELKQERPRLPVLILSVHPEHQYAVRALKLGAAGYMTKESAAEELVQAIRQVVSGGRYVSPTLAETLAYDLAANTGSPRHVTLSERERQVLCLVGSGRTVAEIAEELSLSIKTVSTYRTRMLEKLQMRTTADLIQYAVTNRLVV
ncbi:MAG TPA: response regulator transcription factor [Candidatus Methylomirabilis sp.]|nr:response regulator transcription factor [Candidatus Methylomirabilis sp.]